MNKKVLILLLIFIGMVMLSIIFFLRMNESEKTKEEYVTNRKELLKAEHFLMDHLMTTEGMIQTNFSHQQGAKVFLSESNGLWLQYLSMTGDHQAFALAYRTAKEQLQLNTHLFSWRINNGEKASTNALIDDLRIIEALFREGERTNQKKWTKEAINISKSLLKYQNLDGYLVDFYDEALNKQNASLTISYMNMIPLHYMKKHQLIDNHFTDRIEQFLVNLPMENGFYPKTYDIKNDLFIYDETINMIDQLYVAYYLERAQIETDEFYEWLEETYDLRGIIYGRYSKKTKSNTVDYESAAVYALTILYALEKKETTFALNIWNKLKDMQINNKDSKYDGGYIFENSTHSFDNLLALIAERKLKSEKLIQ